MCFVVNCDNQAELDRYWNAPLEGSSAEQCGWLKMVKIDIQGLKRAFERG